MPAECLDSLLEQQPPPAEILVVDNHSDDGSAAFVTERYPEVRVIDTGRNGGPGLARNNDDYGAMLVMTRLLSQFPGGRLHQALRGEGPGLAYAVWAYPQTGIEPGFWAIVFNTSPKSVQEAIQRSVKLVDELHHGEWADEEVERARTATLVEEALSSQSNGQRAMEAALGEVYGVGYQALGQLIDQINRTDGQRIGEVARRYLRQPTAVILSPEPVDISELPALEAAGADTAPPSPDG